MSVTQKILITLTAHVITEFIDIFSVFEGEGQEVGLKNLAPDEFGSDTEQDIKAGGDGAKAHNLHVLNSANADVIDVNITNAGQLTIDHNANSSDAFNGVFTAPFVYENIPGKFDVEIFTGDNADANYELVGLYVRDPAASVGQEDWIRVISGFHTGVFKTIRTNTINSSSSETVISNSVAYRYLRIVREPALAEFRIYVKLNAEDDWLPRGAYTRLDFGNLIQVGIASQQVNTSNTYVSQTDYLRFNSGGLWSDSSPSSSEAWMPMGSPCTVKVKTATTHRFKDGITIEDLSGSGDDLVVQFKHAVDGGSLGVSRALSAFRAQGDIEVTSSPEASKVITSITRIENVATATFEDPHGYSTGDGIIIEGVNESMGEFNGPKAGVIVTGDYTIEYNVPGSPTTPATGTITGKRHNAIKIVGIYASDSTIESKSSAGFRVDVVFPEGNGNGKYDKFGKYGHRRPGA